MILGVMLKCFNCIHFGEWIDFFFEWVPQILFMCLVFGYMCAQIFIKWCIDWSLVDSPAPSIITNMINLALQAGNIMKETPLWHNKEQ